MHLLAHALRLDYTHAPLLRRCSSLSGTPALSPWAYVTARCRSSPSLQASGLASQLANPNLRITLLAPSGETSGW